MKNNTDQHLDYFIIFILETMWKIKSTVSHEVSNNSGFNDRCEY